VTSEDIHIPVNLEECFEALNKILDKEQVEEFKNWEENVVGKCHHGLGRTLRNDWGLWNDPSSSSLQEYFKNMGIWHADDMSGIILDSYHRHLNNKPLDVEKQVKFYKDYWKKI
jgi:hypothetical protein